jgi:hypothetical protein
VMHHLHPVDTKPHHALVFPCGTRHRHARASVTPELVMLV